MFLQDRASNRGSLDKAAAKFPVEEPRAQRPEPRFFVLFQQLGRPGLQRRSTLVRLGQASELALEANELPARIAALFQPVGKHEAEAVVVRVFDDGLKKTLVTTHRHLSLIRRARRCRNGLAAASYRNE